MACDSLRFGDGTGCRFDQVMQVAAAVMIAYGFFDISVQR